jgi:hypothetical protein
MKIRVIPAIALATLMASHFARACDYQATPLECINVLDPALVKELVWGPGPTHCGEEMSSFWFNRVSGWGFDVPAGGCAPHDIRLADRRVIGGVTRLLRMSRRPRSMSARLRATRSVDARSQCDSMTRGAWSRSSHAR